MEMKSVCPFCSRPVSRYSGRKECPHCQRAIFSVACPKCHRPTLNITLLARYGALTCFSCHTVISQLPVENDEPLPAPPPPRFEAAPASLTPRTPRQPVLPAAGEACALLEKSLVGLERAAQDRELLSAPDLRAVVTRYLDAMQMVLNLDHLMEEGTVTDAWLGVPDHLDLIATLCFSSLWPLQAALLPIATQSWMVTVHEMLCRWQFARRTWLATACGLTLMPTVSGLTTINQACHEVTGRGSIITEVLTPGFLLKDEVLRKARVRA